MYQFPQHIGSNMNTIVLFLSFVAVATATFIPIGDKILLKDGDDDLIRNGLLGGNNVLVKDDKVVLDDKTIYLKDTLTGQLIKKKFVNGVVKTDYNPTGFQGLGGLFGNHGFLFNRLNLGRNEYDVIDTNIRIQVDRCIKTGNEIDFCKNLGVKLVVDTCTKHDLDIDLCKHTIKNLVVDTCEKLGLDIVTCKHIVDTDKLKFHVLLNRKLNQLFNTGRDFTTRTNLYNDDFYLKNNFNSGIHRLAYI